MRIIGGRWRNSKLPVVAAAGLRPTGDRLRETLFNWLAGAVVGSHCLDLFAGSGALGFEALSRGAAHCDFVDSQRVAAVQLNANKVKLGAAATIHLQRDEAFIAGRSVPPGAGYQLVFLDPPFAERLLESCAEQLEASGLLDDECWIYTELASDQPFAPPPSWSLHREKSTGGVHCRLYRRVVGTDVIA